MEIKKVNNEIINEYPKITEFNKKDLKKYVPKKWTKIGISSFIFGLLMKATTSKAISINEIELAGTRIVEDPNPVYKIYELVDKGAEISKVLSIVLLISSIIITIIKEDKKEKNTKLTNKKIKILYIITGISIIVTIIAAIAVIILGFFKNII